MRETRESWMAGCERPARTLLSAQSPQFSEDMSTENIAGLVVAAALVLYLIAALIFPERF
jgi:K+-transporting ATPase KdpF subunit